MKNICVFLMIVCFSSSVIDAQQDHNVVIGSNDSVHSAILKEDRKVWVYVPKAPENSNTVNKYPVVYLLDGDSHFISVAGMIQQLSSINGNTICPQMIVVGILNTDRTRDLTPTHINADQFMDSASAKTSGGAEYFLSFIEKELMPHIDSLYPTAPYRMLIGHSFGGLFVINTLVHHKNLFNSFVAIDPSMWWDNQKLLKETEQSFKKDDFKSKKLFLGIANNLPDGMDTSTVKSDTASGSLHIRSILKLIGYLKNNKQNHLTVDYKYYNEDSHGSVPLITEYDALHFIFKGFTLQFKNVYISDTTFKIDSFISAHYKNVSALLGYSILPPEDMVNQAGHFLMGFKQVNRAEQLFKLNVTNYPMSFNAYDALGDLYNASGNKTGAIDCYLKSLSFKNSEETRKKIEKLQAK